jgi:hypothetical protein
MNNYSQCYYPENDDCFAKSRLMSGKEECRILDNTDFGTRRCPFYKSYAQFRKERETHGGEIDARTSKEKAE